MFKLSLCNLSLFIDLKVYGLFYLIYLTHSIWGMRLDVNEDIKRHDIYIEHIT